MTQIKAVDGHQVVGTDGEMPTQRISQFEVHLAGGAVAIEPALYVDIYEPRFKETEFKVQVMSGGAGVKITMDGSDGAGFYTVTWDASLSGPAKRTLATEH